MFYFIDRKIICNITITWHLHEWSLLQEKVVIMNILRVILDGTTHNL